MRLAPTTFVDDIMRQWPSTIQAFLDHRMSCVGCPVGCFHTVEDACREHGVDRSAFLADLHKAAADPEEVGPAAYSPS